MFFWGSVQTRKEKVGEAWIRGEQGSRRGGGANVGFAKGFILPSSTATDTTIITLVSSIACSD
jgi:hypothetical protein